MTFPKFKPSLIYYERTLNALQFWPVSQNTFEIKLNMAKIPKYKDFKLFQTSFQNCFPNTYPLRCKR